ncbi:MAG: ribosome biogenesis GTPase YlqF [Pseudohongiellaceae bacterium]|nr:ribosome biogenesis GTPase YlqF [Pseudohongiellaceae bacterium]
MAISWYPGHMHKANKEMAAIIKNIDVVIEVLDARLPAASSNPMLETLRKDKPCLRVLNKADLADPKVTKAWLKYYNEQPLSFATSRSKSQRLEASDVIFLCKKLLKKVQSETKKDEPSQASNPQLQNLKAWKQENKKQQILIVGIPNVGKSSIMNQLLGKKIAKTGNEPAVTKGQQRVRLNKNWFLVDTPGVLWPRLDDQDAAYRLALSGAIRNTAIEFADIALYAAQMLLDEHPEGILARYKFAQTPSSGEELLKELAVKRGCIKKDKEIDWNRISELLINDYRAGRLGLVSLETPAGHIAKLARLAQEQEENSEPSVD